jgi:hypothetical protein
MKKLILANGMYNGDAMNFEIQKAAEILRQTPDTLRRMLEGLSDDWTASNGNVESWAPYDVIGHLIHGEETDWVTRAELILGQGQNRTFDKYDRTAQFEKSGGRSLDDLLNEFARLRTANLETVLGWQLTTRQLSLKGTHPALGEVTLEQLLATWAVHDLNHIRQIVTYMARRYEQAVGPWKEYLSILQ